MSTLSLPSDQNSQSGSESPIQNPNTCQTFQCCEVRIPRHSRRRLISSSCKPHQIGQRLDGGYHQRRLYGCPTTLPVQPELRWHSVSKVHYQLLWMVGERESFPFQFTRKPRWRNVWLVVILEEAMSEESDTEKTYLLSIH